MHIGSHSISLADAESDGNKGVFHNMKFCFGDIVVVEGLLIGVVVKSWCGSENREPHHEVYVRSHNCIQEYSENDMQRYMVRHKYLDEEELEWQYNAVHGY